MKNAILSFLTFFLLPLSAFATCSLSITPTTYVQGTNPITADTNQQCTDELGVYLDSSSSLPYAYNTNLGVNYADQNLNSPGNAWDVGGFSQSNQPIGFYSIVIPQDVSCYNLSYTNCAAANTNVPGSQEADIEITTSSASTSSLTQIMTTTTDQAIGNFFHYGFYLLIASTILIIVYWIKKL